MRYKEKRVEEIKIAYVGGGSRGWAWELMSDLASCEDISGDVYLYDIDYESACHNEVIGNLYKSCEGARSQWNYHAVETPAEAMTDADFVIISILPGTFDEMASDVHTPEKYGIYQPVGDSTGPGGIVRAMRTIPMYEQIAGYVRDYCPNAWVISYTNPMTLCVDALYRTFPQIKAFGCCHEVFGTQTLLCDMLRDEAGILGVQRDEIKVNPVAVNHFTWLTSASYKNEDLFPIYSAFAARYAETGYCRKDDTNWLNRVFACTHRVKFELFRQFGSIAAAGDRHLAEFCNGRWFLRDPETVKSWGFHLTPVSWRREQLEFRLRQSEEYRSGKKLVQVHFTGEEGVQQIRAILGLRQLITNVNLPNSGQIGNLSRGAVVETNAVFRDGSVTPVMAGDIPEPVYPLVSKICAEQLMLGEALQRRDMEGIFAAFVCDALVTCGLEDARCLFKEMVRNTAAYLGDYDLV